MEGLQQRVRGGETLKRGIASRESGRARGSICFIKPFAILWHYYSSM